MRTYAVRDCFCGAGELEFVECLVPLGHDRSEERAAVERYACCTRKLCTSIFFDIFFGFVIGQEGKTKGRVTMSVWRIQVNGETDVVVPPLSLDDLLCDDIASAEERACGDTLRRHWAALEKCAGRILSRQKRKAEGLEEERRELTCTRVCLICVQSRSSSSFHP